MPNTACSEDTYNELIACGFMERLPELYDIVARLESRKFEYQESSEGCENGVCPTA
jgi:hypothetical protein